MHVAIADLSPRFQTPSQVSSFIRHCHSCCHLMDRATFLAGLLHPVAAKTKHLLILPPAKKGLSLTSLADLRYGDWRIKMWRRILQGSERAMGE